ncbi:MAG: hypothetical protein ACP5OZ_04670 [Candidatus Woesearchaeota archaeon]
MINIIIGQRVLGNQSQFNADKHVKNENPKNIELLIKENNLEHENIIKTVYPTDVDPLYHVYSLYTKGCTKKDKNYLIEAINKINYYLTKVDLDEKKIKRIKEIEYKTFFALTYFNLKFDHKKIKDEIKNIKKGLTKNHELSKEDIQNLEKEVEDYFNRKPVIFYKKLDFN